MCLWKKQGPPTLQPNFTRLHGVTFMKTAVLYVTTVRNPEFSFPPTVKVKVKFTV
jgi:hypothetical protein